MCGATTRRILGGKRKKEGLRCGQDALLCNSEQSVWENRGRAGDPLMQGKGAGCLLKDRRMLSGSHEENPLKFQVGSCQGKSCFRSIALMPSRKPGGGEESWSLGAVRIQD